MNNRLIKSNDAGGGGCTNTVDLYNPFPDGGGVALYQLNGDATDVSGNYDGTASNVTYGTGQFGQAGVFNGSTSAINTTYTPTVANLRTVSLWFKGGTQSDYKFLFTVSPYGVSGRYSWASAIMLSDGRIYGGYQANNGGAVYILTSNDSYDDNNWHNLVLIFNGSYGTGSFVKMYIDNEEILTTPNTANNTSLSTIEGTFRIGHTYFQNTSQVGNVFDGSIDQVRIFNRALRPYEVEALYTEEYCTPTIVPSEHFNTVLYTGTNSSLPITGLGFQPDLVWIKNRTGTVDHHSWIDSVRGKNSQLFSNLTNGENTFTDQLDSFDSDGFTVGTGFVGTEAGRLTNKSGEEYVAWNFKAGGAAVTNTDGTITSQVSANTEAGFSIVSYTGNGVSGATVGHGLDVAPSVMIFKRTNATESWNVWHSSIPTKVGFLNLTDAFINYSVLGSNSTQITLNNGTGHNASAPYIAYCFAEVEGFSSFGSYVGTGASGNTIITGFEPAFVMIKRTDSTGNWFMLDNKRDNTNPNNLFLLANASDSEKDLQVTDALDFVNFLENGFEVLNGGAFCNASGGSYIYMAFAADPTTVEPTLEDSFNTVTYTGNGGTQSVTSVGFQPDLVWFKNRDTTNYHQLLDSIRGAGNRLFSNITNAESFASDTLQSFDPNGFTVGSDNDVNGSGYGIVAWCWKGAELPAINSNGSIPSVVSANPAAGFSIVSYTANGTDGASVGHGLGSAPKMIIYKGRNAVGDWIVLTTAIDGSADYLFLNTTAAKGDYPSNYIPTDNLFYSISSSSTLQFIAYCFAEVAGFSKFGSYSGNGSTQSINVGFEPAFVMLKRTNATSDWAIADNKRTDGELLANKSDFERIENTPDFDSNGFTMTSVRYNGIGEDWIYMAFANQF